MTAAGVIIGVDAYADQPLTSAVHDALAVRDELVSLGLLKSSEVRLLTAPVVDGAELADSGSIDRALHAIYDDGSAIDRLFVFFAGHGLMAPIDPARGTFSTAVVPVDVRDLRMDSRLLFNVDDLVDRLSLGGPREQFFFIDACRDLAFGENPGNLLPLSWPMSRNPSASANAQAILFAVSPMGTARGTRGGMGEMTGHLIQAMRGAGQALDWSDQDDCHVVTATSMARYVIARVRETVATEPQWQQVFRLPELRPQGPELTPLRVVEAPPTRTLTLTFDPADAAASTTVRLRQRGNVVESPAWPPHAHGEAVAIAPLVYRFDVTSPLGDATADPLRIDAREQESAVIRVGAPPPAPVASSGPGPAAVEDLPPMRGGLESLPDTARIRASAQEPEAVIEVEGLEPPYHSMQAVHTMQQDVPPGSYRIRFRLGDEVFSETEVDLVGGDDKLVSPTVAASPLLSEALNAANEETVDILESIGPVQAEVLPTLLALVGVKPFDKTRAIRGIIEGLVPPLAFRAFGERPLSVLVAIEGDGWGPPIADIATSLECRIVAANGAHAEVALTQLRPGDLGWARVSHGAVAAPGVSFFVNIASPLVGRFECAVASLPGRVSVVTLILRPDGRLDSAQHILRLPGKHYDEPVEHVPYGLMVRQLTLGQRLYESGELVERAGKGYTPLMELLYAKWTDPLLGCMAYYAWADAIAGTGPGEARSMADQTARNLLRYFGALPDARVAAAMALPDHRDTLIDGLLTENAVPVLARSCRELASEAVARGEDGADVVGWATRIPLTDPWTRRFQTATSGTNEEVTGGPAVAVQG